MSDNNGNNRSNPENLAKVFLFNKVNIDGQDDTNYIKDEIQSLIDGIIASKCVMCERRKDIGVGFLFGGNVHGEFRVIELLFDVFESYLLGKYYATVAVASMAAERLCYDFIDVLDIKFGNRTLSIEDKEELTYLPFSKLLTFFKKIGVLNENDFVLLQRINEIRNRHVHPKMKFDIVDDAKLIVKLLCELLEARLSMFKFYEIVDGKFVLKKDKNT